ncbi:MAG: LamG domain-containing protein [Candidatus Poribacteria bacterium]|nr:LamG domain-containing protein [Candidatus Poribacteria bacterium]
MLLKKGYLIYLLTVFAIIVLSLAIIETAEARFAADTIQGMWTFEEGQGKTVKDLSGNGSDGVFVGDVKWAEAKFGGGIEFSGEVAQNYVRIGKEGEPATLAALNFKDSKGFSIHAWVFATIPPNGKCVIWKGKGCSSWSQFLLGTGAHENVGGRINRASFHFRTRSAPERFEALGEELPQNEWVHLVGVWDGTKIYIYVNGKLQGSADAVGQPWDSFEAVYIGADAGCNEPNGRCHWGGIIDEIVIFNVPISEDEIKSLGNGIEGVFAVDAGGKITTTWSKLKSSK